LTYRRARSASWFVGLLLLVASACAPQGQVSGPAPSAPERPAARKVLTIADSYEPKFIIESFTSDFFPQGNNMMYLVHDNLVNTIQYQNYTPQLASEVPSIEKGTWKVNPDGTMETIWKLRPNVKWHDGAPFTSADVLFTFQTKRDKDIAGAGVNAYDRLIDGASAPDPLTFVVHWNAPYVDAYFISPGQIIPKHLMEEMYLRDKFSLTTTPLTSTEFIGLGPYKLTHWDRGVSFQVDRFDDYYLGRPPLDSIFVRFVGDANTLVANVLSGAVDVAISSASLGVSLDQAAEVRKRWEGTRNQVVNLKSGAALYAEPQLSPLYERPAGAQSNLQVRTALTAGIDRVTIAEVMTHGLSPVPDSYYATDDPRWPELEPHVVKHPYDPTRAMQLLAQAGWSPGSDGILVRQSDGQRFELEFLGRAGPNEKVASIVSDYWRRLGIAATPVITPEANRNDREYETRRPGFLCCIQVPLSSFYNGNSHQRQIPSAATNWIGNNHGSYVNPRGDAIVDQLATTLDPRARLPLEQQLVREYTADVWLTPMWWQIFPQLVLAGVKGPNPAFQLPTRSIFEWDKE
jgi:peptide/nickel transport system substrate-binding protein